LREDRWDDHDWNTWGGAPAATMSADPFDQLRGEGLISEVIRPVKSGKEASVYLCRAGGTAPPGIALIAVKAYRSRDSRSFKNDGVYTAGREIRSRRVRVAVEKRSRFGRSVTDVLWVNRELEVLGLLGDAGADVPRVLGSAESAIAMQYVGDEDAAAPQLRHVTLSPAEASAVFDRLLWNVELWLSHRVIHGDLSAFNVLWWDGRATVIDFPQAVDAQKNPHASELLLRDVTNLCGFFERFGLRRDPRRIASGLWNRFIFAEL
jgi:RIO kinase 1